MRTLARQRTSASSTPTWTPHPRNRANQPCWKRNSSSPQKTQTSPSPSCHTVHPSPTAAAASPSASRISLYLVSSLQLFRFRRVMCRSGGMASIPGSAHGSSLPGTLMPAGETVLPRRHRKLRRALMQLSLASLLHGTTIAPHQPFRKSQSSKERGIYNPTWCQAHRRKRPQGEARQGRCLTLHHPCA